MIIEIEKAIGRKLRGVVRSGTGSRMLLVFDGGVKCQLSINMGYDPGDEEIVDDLDFDSWEYDKDDLLRSKAVDLDFLAECKRLANVQQQLAKERQEAEEAKEYERLKKKFGSA